MELNSSIEPTRAANTFAGRVAAVFGTQVFGAALGIVNGILLAHLLGPAAKGDYFILLLLPVTAMVLIQFGLPEAFIYYAARIRTAGIVIKAFVLTLILSSAALVVVYLLLPFLRSVALRDIPLELIALAFVTLPIALGATFMAAIVTGRQAIKWYSVVNTATPIVTTVLLVAILGGLGPSVAGALAVWLIASAFKTVALAIGAARASATGARSDEPVTYGQLLKYALPYYPGSLTNYFSARLDAYIIAWLIADPSAPLGYYSMAVGLAELVFFFPTAVETLFFPHVAGSSREDSNRQVPVVARVSLVVAGLVALALVPGAIFMIKVLLPAFTPTLPALFVLLPGVVALSLTKVVGGYVIGIGRPGINSAINIAAAVVNVAVNLLLIPTLGIVGAAAASLISYTLSAVLFTVVAARLSNRRTVEFWAVGWSDLRLAMSMGTGLLRRFRGKSVS